MRIQIFLVLSLCWGFAVVGRGQPSCNLLLKGYVKDSGTGIPLPYSNIYLDEIESGAVADSMGFFKIEGLCPGEYHLDVHHLGCETEHLFIYLTKDTLLQIQLNHHTELLDEVVVHGETAEASAQNSSSVSRQSIEQNSNQNLSDILEQIAGVSVLKNGAGISKPVVHGLFGNRVGVLNNGIAQAGQQWGNDHAPEIDPFVADHLSVVKGASALMFAGSTLGSMVLVEAGAINPDPHLHGRMNYSLQTNGWGHTLNAQLEKSDGWAAWRLTGTLKLQGDSRSPNYFLTNTGKREANLALQVEKDFGADWKNEFYLSTFNTEIGILRGAHIGNLTDLEAAIGREQPFFTADTFSYAINEPRQLVRHHLFKWESQYLLSDTQVLKFKYGWQLNDRKEFDVRRGGRDTIPALSLLQFANFLELSYHHQLKRSQLLKSGVQFQYIDNNNLPGTGVLPLLPNYNSQLASAFLIWQVDWEKWFFEAGGRYDFRFLDVSAISLTLPVQVEEKLHRFHNYAVSTGARYNWKERLKTSLNIGYMLRAPEVNELYSMGLHQGVSGIEEGSRDLQQEKSLKLILSTDCAIQKRLFIQALLYFQPIQDYIFLEPQDQFRLTIRGAFPVFNYQQTDALLYGGDFLLTYEPQKNLKWLLKYAQVTGRDRSNQQGLVFIPANNLYSALTWSLDDGPLFKLTKFSVNGKYVFEQSNITEEQDFMAPPEAYFLLGTQLETTLHLGESKLRASLSVENLLNTTYRDYLNRLRYFADDLGRNIRLQVSYSF